MNIVHVRQRATTPGWRWHVIHYKCLLFDNDDKVRAFEGIEAENDVDALWLAQRCIATPENQPLIEVWEGRRVVGRLKFGEPIRH